MNVLFAIHKASAKQPDKLNDMMLISNVACKAMISLLSLSERLQSLYAVGCTLELFGKMSHQSMPGLVHVVTRQDSGYLQVFQA